MTLAWKRHCTRAGTKVAAEEVTAGLCRGPRAAPQSSARDHAVALGRVPRSQPGRLSLQPFLRAVPAMAQRSSTWLCGRSTRPGRRFSSTGPARRSIYDRVTGVAWQASLFVASLGASSYSGWLRLRSSLERPTTLRSLGNGTPKRARWQRRRPLFTRLTERRPSYRELNRITISYRHFHRHQPTDTGPTV